MRIESRGQLDGRQVTDVLALAGAAVERDVVGPLSEQTTLDVRRGQAAASTGAGSGADDGESGSTVHLLAYDDTVLVGYAHLELVAGDADGQQASAELVVHPDHRRRGVGGQLLQELRRRAPGVRVWAHGDLDSARKLVGAIGMTKVRDLWQMRRPLAGEWSELPQVELPEGFAARSFEPGRDEQAWLTVNGRAFASHAEQGRMTRSDLDERMAEPWFDPAGFILVEDVTTAEPTLAAFHWTKVEPDGATSPDGQHDHPATSGEVYVVGVDPAYQGLGLGKVVTVLGLAHLRDRGLQAATLYVDGDNDAAIATYTRLGFERSTVDVMYADEAPGSVRP